MLGSTIPREPIDKGGRLTQLACSPTFVFFDGTCATCHFVVKFLLRRRSRQRFRFVALQSIAATPLEKEIHAKLGLDLSSSLIVWKNGELWAKASAVFVILSELSWPWKAALILRLLPRFLSDKVYDLYALRRYRIAGYARDPDICAVLPQSQRQLFPSNWSETDLVFRPRRDVFLSAQWRKLVLVNYEVPAEILQPYLPVGLELDLWQNKALVSLVAFSFIGTSVAGMTLPWAADFEEVNLRFYVKRLVEEGGLLVERRGVVFVREIVPYSIIALTANLFYGERYQKLSMQHASQGSETVYRWSDKRGTCSMRAKTPGEPEPLEAGSLPEFITEHYYGYAKAKSALSKTIEYEVEHPRWRIWPRSTVSLEGDIARFYPGRFTPYLQTPHSLLVAEGSPVRVMRGQAIRT